MSSRLLALVYLTCWRVALSFSFWCSVFSTHADGSGACLAFLLRGSIDAMAVACARSNAEKVYLAINQRASIELRQKNTRQHTAAATAAVSTWLYLLLIVEMRHYPSAATPALLRSLFHMF